MHIAMIGLRGIPSREGGVEVAVEELAPRLVKLGFDVTVYCRTHYMKGRPKTYRGVKLCYLPTINNKYFEAIVHTLLSSVHALFINKIDIVHYHALGNALFSWVPGLVGKCCVVTIHGLDYEREKWSPFAKLVLKMGETMAIRYAHSIISVSKKIQLKFLSQYSREPNFIPNGVPALIPGKAVEAKPYILFLSRLVPEKGVHTLIKAFKDVVFDGNLHIVGSGTHTDKYVNELNELARDDARVKLLGPKFDQEKSDQLKNALLFVLPSTIEGMPIVLLEAMSMGTACLVSDIVENMEVITRADGMIAYSFRSDDILSLKTELQQAIDSRESLHSMGLKAQEVVTREYDWDNIAIQTGTVYDQVGNT